MKTGKSLLERCRPALRETPPDISAMMPPDGLFPEYLQYASQATDAPETFHLGAALAAFSAAVAGKTCLEIKLERGAVVTTPLHLWIMLVGDSSARKSSVCNRALRTLYSTETGPTGGTMQAIYSWVAANPTSLFYFPELTTLFHQNGFAPFLSEIFDGNDFRRTVVATGGVKQEIVILRPRTAILTCATWQTLQMLVTKVDWIGGVFGRMLPVFGERTQLKVFGNARDAATEAVLHRHVERCMDAVGDGATIGLAAGAADVYKDWVNQIEALLPDRPDHVKAALTRLPTHILRVAGLYALSSSLDEIGPDTMCHAVALGNYVLKTIDKLGIVLSPDPIIRNTFVLRNLLELFPEGMSLREVQATTGVAWRTLEGAAMSMCAAGELTILLNPKTKQKWVTLVA